MRTEAIQCLREEMLRHVGHPDAKVRYMELLQCGVIRAEACKCQPAPDSFKMMSVCTCNQTDAECESRTRIMAESIRHTNDEAPERMMSDMAKFSFSLFIEFHVDKTR